MVPMSDGDSWYDHDMINAFSVLCSQINHPGWCLRYIQRWSTLIYNYFISVSILEILNTTAVYHRHIFKYAFGKDENNLFPKISFFIYDLFFSRIEKFLVFCNNTPQWRWKRNFWEILSNDTHSTASKFAQFTVFEENHFFKENIFSKKN